MKRLGPALAVLLALPVLAAVTAPSPAAGAARSVTTTYDCAAPVLLGSIEGPLRVTVHARFPRRVDVGERILARSVALDAAVPPEVVDQLRWRGITWVSAQTAPTGRSVSYRVGDRVRPVVAFSVGRRDVPASGGMALRGRGVAAGVRFRTPGTRAVKVPLSFRVLGHTSSSLVSELPITCTLAEGAPERLGRIRVVR